MLCKYCGKELNDDAKFCTQCGAGLDQPETATEPVAAKPKVNKKKIIAVAVVALAVMAALVVFFNIKSNSVNASPEAVAAAFLISDYALDIETQVKCCPDFMIREIAEDYDLPKNASSKVLRKELVKELTGRVAGKTPEKVKIKSVKVVKEYDLRDMEEGYHFGNNRYLSYDLEYTTARDLKNMRTAAEVKVRYTVDGEEYTEEIFTVKIRNKWYILPVAYAMPAPVE